MAIGPLSDDNNNTIIGEPVAQERAEVRFSARNCKLIIGAGVTLRDLRIDFESDGGIVEIGDQVRLMGNLSIGVQSRVTIGSRVSFRGGSAISAREGATVMIGDDCMFSRDILITTDDAHPIFDLTTGERVNPSRGIAIGKRVWLGLGASVMKGASIGDGSVIGLKSVVTGAVPNDCIAVGVPAKVVRRNIVWSKTHLGHVAPHRFDRVADLPRHLQPKLRPASEPVRSEKRGWLARLLRI